MNFIENSRLRPRIFVSLREMFYSFPFDVCIVASFKSRPDYLAKESELFAVKGFACSANTYVEATLVLSHGAGFKSAHHGHHFVHVEEVVLLSKPCIVLFRNPKDVIPSQNDFGQCDGIEQIADRYTSIALMH